MLSDSYWSHPEVILKSSCLLCLLKERYIWTKIHSNSHWVRGHWSLAMGQDPGTGHDATPAKWRSPLSTKPNLLSGNQDQTRFKSWKNGAAFQLKELQWTLYDVLSSSESRSFTRSLTTKTKLYSVFSLYWNNLENFHSKLFELWEKSWSLVFRFLMCNKYSHSWDLEETSTSIFLQSFMFSLQVSLKTLL